MLIALPTMLVQSAPRSELELESESAREWVVATEVPAITEAALVRCRRGCATDDILERGQCAPRSRALRSLSKASPDLAELVEPLLCSVSEADIGHSV